MKKSMNKPIKSTSGYEYMPTRRTRKCGSNEDYIGTFVTLSLEDAAQKSLWYRTDRDEDFSDSLGESCWV